ncbi:MAG TPA: cupredoxin domain-containing protein [Motilibacteraceae bacterium]|nr:cupredoxin domain-containing protein [Motilibacteraceae bacterium]
MRPRSLLLLTVALAAAPALTACGSDSGASTSASGGSVAVTATDSTCEPATTTLPAGDTTFSVTNKGTKTTELYVYAASGDAFTKVVGEVEDVAPGTSRQLSAQLSAGTYELACKPGQSGDGIRTKITVS